MPLPVQKTLSSVRRADKAQQVTSAGSSREGLPFRSALEVVVYFIRHANAEALLSTLAQCVTSHGFVAVYSV